MQKPKVFNRTLNKKWAEEENTLMINKLNSVKAKVDIHCPESYVFYQTQFRKTQARNNRLKQFEIDKDNQVLFDKIMHILTVNPNEEIKKRKPKHDLKKDIYLQAKKYDYFKVSQENQYLLKRLNDKNSFYDIKSWEKDYDKSQTYKKNLCVFPSIDFRKTNINNFHIRNHSKRNKSLYDKIKILSLDNLTGENKEKMKSGSEMKYENGKNKLNAVDRSSQVSNSNENYDSNKRKILYNKKMFLNELSHCSVTFFVQDKKLIIEVEPIILEKIYYIVFDETEDIEKMQKIYKKYEQIITDLDYDFVNDRVFIKNKGDINLLYKSLAISNQEKFLLENADNKTVTVITKEDIEINGENEINRIEINDKHKSVQILNKQSNNHDTNDVNTIEFKYHKEQFVTSGKEIINQISEKEESITSSKRSIKSSSKSLKKDYNINSTNKIIEENQKFSRISSNSINKSIDSINYNLENGNEDQIEENLK